MECNFFSHISISSTATLSTQGCLSSPLLFILYTSDCFSSQTNQLVIKYSSNTVTLVAKEGQEAADCDVVVDLAKFPCWMSLLAWSSRPARTFSHWNQCFGRIFSTLAMTGMRDEGIHLILFATRVCYHTINGWLITNSRTYVTVTNFSSNTTILASWRNKTCLPYSQKWCGLTNMTRTEVLTLVTKL